MIDTANSYCNCGDTEAQPCDDPLSGIFFLGKVNISHEKGSAVSDFHRRIFDLHLQVPLLVYIKKELNSLNFFFYMGNFFSWETKIWREIGFWISMIPGKREKIRLEQVVP